MENESFLEGNGIIILILFFLFMGGGVGFGMNKGNYATQEDLFNTSNTNGINAKLDTMSQAINNSVYENMQNTNNITQAMNNGFNGITNQLTSLGYQMSQCCCDLKTQMLNDKYEALNREYNIAVNASANAVQTQNILNALGKYVPFGYLNGTSTI